MHVIDSGGIHIALLSKQRKYPHNFVLIENKNKLIKSQMLLKIRGIFDGTIL